MSKSVCIRSCATEPEAEVVTALLKAHGIHAIVSADDCVGLPLMFSDGVKVFVLEEDADQASDILAHAGDEETAEG